MEQFDDPESCKITLLDDSRSKLRRLSDSVYIDATTDSEENNFRSENEGVLKPTNRSTKTAKRVDTPYYFDRDELIIKTIENFYKFGILPVVKILKCELSCHHGRFIELMIKTSFEKEREKSKQIYLKKFENRICIRTRV
nr:hypothetical protein MACL_00001278 [Theileria orientalis]